MDQWINKFLKYQRNNNYLKPPSPLSSQYSNLTHSSSFSCNYPAKTPPLFFPLLFPCFLCFFLCFIIIGHSQFIEMDIAPSKHKNKPNPRFTPRRGQIKIKIIKKIAHAIVSLTVGYGSKGGGNGGCLSLASTTPPEPSNGFNSDCLSDKWFLPNFNGLVLFFGLVLLLCFCSRNNTKLHSFFNNLVVILYDLKG